MKRKVRKRLKRQELITSKTLVIGIDIGKEFNAAAMMDDNGKILELIRKQYNSHEGYKIFFNDVKRLLSGKRFEKVAVGMEPTGHYWRKIAFRCIEAGFEVRFVKTGAVRVLSELEDSTQAKSDIKDAILIANLLREGNYLDTHIKRDKFIELRSLVKFREKLARDKSSLQNQIIVTMDDYFPEVMDKFSTSSSKGLLALLKEYPFPSDVLKAEENKIAELIGKASKRNETAKVKAREIVEAAKISVGMKDVFEADRLKLKMMLEELEDKIKQIKVIESKMQEIMSGIEQSKYILSIPGVGLVTSSIFLGELGNPDYFNNYREIVKYAGADPYETESGQFFGRRKMSKKGRYVLRTAIYMMILGVVRSSSYFRRCYEKKLKGKKGSRRLEKKEALWAVGIKLIKVIFALLRDKREFVDKQRSLKKPEQQEDNALAA